jgi:hypothetical protein
LAFGATEGIICPAVGAGAAGAIGPGSHGPEAEVHAGPASRIVHTNGGADRAGARPSAQQRGAGGAVPEPAVPAVCVRAGARSSQPPRRRRNVIADVTASSMSSTSAPSSSSTAPAGSPGTGITSTHSGSVGDDVSDMAAEVVPACAALRGITFELLGSWYPHVGERAVLATIERMREMTS